MAELTDDLLSPGYSQSDETRFLPEPAKRSGRTAFARDRARILHSAGLRRLAAKTQILVAGTADFPRTRLTHTLEVAQIGRELGLSLGCDPDLVEVGCLAHDLGHPPFGHNGEAALAEIAQPCGGFEGNAQTLRLLTRLEAKTFASDGTSLGLNLTRASLDAAVKYPWSVTTDPLKYGFYADDEPIFEWLRQGSTVGRKCFEAQVMDWADDVAYSVHDVEDAVVGGHLNLGVLNSVFERESIIALARQSYTSASEGEVSEAMDRLLALDFWPGDFDGGLNSLARLKNFTSQLIGRFCQAADQATRAEYGSGRLTRYGAELIVPAAAEAEVAVLKTLANLYVMQRDGAADIYERQQEVLKGLVTALTLRDGVDLEPAFAPAWQAAADDAGRLRAVIDQVASLTDHSAVEWHGRLCTSV